MGEERKKIINQTIYNFNTRFFLLIYKYIMSLILIVHTFIALIPKVDNLPEVVCPPISLISYV